MLQIVFKSAELAWLTDWEAVFGGGEPLELEIGVGNGEFLVQQASMHPQTNFVGVEIAAEFVRRARNRIAGAG